MKDRILVYDGPDDKSMLIGELSGTPSHKVMKSISSSGKIIFIDFKAHYGAVEFVAFIKFNTFNPDCQSLLDENILMSPINPNINCSWIITRKSGSYITLDFNFIEVRTINTIAKMI